MATQKPPEDKTCPQGWSGPDCNEFTGGTVMPDPPPEDDPYETPDPEEPPPEDYYEDTYWPPEEPDPLIEVGQPPCTRFHRNDKIVNFGKSYPFCKFSIYDAKVYLNNQNAYSGAFTDQVLEISGGYISLYELNVDRDFSAHTYDPTTDTGTKTIIYPWITKGSNWLGFATITGSEDPEWNQLDWGAILTGTYPLSSSITREEFAEDHELNDATGSHLLALKNTFNNYQSLCPAYAFSSSLGGWDKALDRGNLISIPSIFFSSQIKKGSVKLNYYLSGAIIGTLEDTYQNGCLIQTDGTSYAQDQGSASVGGVVLYNEGFIYLSGSWNLAPDTYDLGSVIETPKWVNFGVGCNDGFSSGEITHSASFEVIFKGTTITPTLTLFAHAKKGQLNYSSNPTYVDKTTRPGAQCDDATAYRFTATSSSYLQPNNMKFKNTISSSFCNYSASFAKQTFISKVGIYDVNRNLIGVAHMARPVRKRENDEYTFKLKLDF